MFCGMFSPHDSQAVLDDLGDKVPLALLRATERARADYAAFRAAFPDWLPGMFERELADVIHPRIWAHLVAELEGVEGVTLVAREPVREIGIAAGSGHGYVARIKRHGDGDRISSYPTRTDIEFWAGGVMTFEGYERVNLAFGYRWDRERREMGSPVISYREGKDNVVWAVLVDAGTGALPLSYEPIEPDLPQIDLLDASRETDERDHDERYG